MSFDPHSRRFDPRRPFPAIETDEDKTFGAPDGFPAPRTRTDERAG